MRKRIAYALIIALLLLLSFGAGYWSGFSHARSGTRIIVQRDSSDIPGVTTAKTEYEPYFTKQNPIPDRVR